MSTSRGPEERLATDEARSGARRRARERALDLLYEAESKAVSPAAVLAGLPVAPDPYAAELVAGVGTHQAEIDALLAAAASGWRLERMPVVDRQLLRVAVYELLERPEVPVAVILDEAVELAKAFSTEGSGRFVNGVLATIAADRRGGERSAGESRPA